MDNPANVIYLSDESEDEHVSSQNIEVSGIDNHANDLVNQTNINASSNQVQSKLPFRNIEELGNSQEVPMSKRSRRDSGNSYNVYDASSDTSNNTPNQIKLLSNQSMDFNSNPKEQSVEAQQDDVPFKGQNSSIEADVISILSDDDLDTGIQDHQPEIVTSFIPHMTNPSSIHGTSMNVTSNMTSNINDFNNDSTSDISITNNRSNVNQANELASISNSFLNNDDDLQSDDEIMELDPDEAARTGLFDKPSSRQSAINVDRDFEVIHTTVASPSNDRSRFVQLAPQFNDPAPVYHAGSGEPNPELRMLNTQISGYQSRYDYLNSSCNRLTHDIPILTEKLRSVLKLIQDKTARFSTLSFNSSDDALLKRQLLSEIEVDRREFVKHKSSLNRTTEILTTRKRERDIVYRDLSDAVKRSERLKMNQAASQGYNPIINGINTAINSFSNMASLFLPNTYDMQAASSNTMSGYTQNIYSKAEDVDIAELLNNIQSTELEEEGMALTPIEMSVTLLKHQRMGLSWLMRMESNKSKGGILADDMGLGKTVQAIALMVANRSEDENCKTNLVVGPVSLLRQWAAEIESKIKPGIKIKVGVYHGNFKKQLSTFRQMKRYDVIMTSYGTLSSEFKKHFKSPLEEARVTKNQDVIPDIDAGGGGYKSPFFGSDAKFYRIFLDEAQNVKNRLSIASKAVACLSSTFRFCLSGTPMQNNVDELFPLIRFLHIRPYNDQTRFNSEISGPLKSKSANFDTYDKEQSMKKLRALLRAILLRRTKDTKIDGEPLLTLPAKHLLRDFVKMEEEEKAYYTQLEGDIQKKAKSLMLKKSKGVSSSILTLLLRLRQACIHSYLVEIGLMSKEENEEDRKLLPATTWQQMYETVTNFDYDVIERIKLEVHRGGTTKTTSKATNSTSAVLADFSGNADLSTGNSSKIKKIEDENDDFVSQDLDDENFFTCPICFNVVGVENLVLFAGCGHLICSDCIENFFEDNETGDGGLDGKRSASCISCQKVVKENQLIDYSIFHKVHYEGYDFYKLRDFFFQDKKKKTTTSQKVQKLIAANDGFVPSAKMERAIELMKNVFEKYPGEKIIVFSQFTVTFDLMKILLNHEKIPFYRYDGSMSIDQKNSTIKSFYQTDVKVMLLSLRAGNVGLTLTCASHVVILDPFWNPFVEEQAMDRAYRIGQQREVFVHRILIEGTVESRIMELQEKKKELIEAALDEQGMQGVSRLGRKELGFLFGLNHLN